MLRGNNANNIECTTTPGDDDNDSNDDNVSLECADSGLGLTSDQDADRVVLPPASVNIARVPQSTVTAGYRPVLTSAPADARRGLTDRQPVH